MQCVKREKEDVDTLSEWIKAVKSLKSIKSKILDGFINCPCNVAKHLSYLTVLNT